MKIKRVLGHAAPHVHKAREIDRSHYDLSYIIFPYLTSSNHTHILAVHTHNKETSY